ncbi:MAG TPA: leucyl aminopeptidase family protein [Methylovirgula sp.]|nr:leucyl aminopeptidase family protein [Methylovirgula sp.]
MALDRTAGSRHAVPIFFVSAETWPDIRAQLPPVAATFAAASGFEPTPGRVLSLPGADGALFGVLFGLERKDAKSRDPFLPGRLATSLPAGTYRFANAPYEPDLAALAFLLSSYRFTRYKKAEDEIPELLPPDGVDMDRLARIAKAVALGRDLVNTPANDLGPDALEAAALKVAAQFGAKTSVVRGDKLLKENYPLIHAVGRAADQAPRIVEFSWGPQDAPKVTLVGKGVCFDTGGLDIKPEAGMALMKKDMGGAATALALAQMIMAADLSVRLRVILPIVENAIAGNAMRPSDIYPSRKGLTVEIGNTDAEGRLILADALTLADDEAPELLIDFATLTGAARVALGPDLPPFYTMSDALAEEIAQFAKRAHDPVWRMPLWDPYDKLLDGKVGNLSNITGGPFAGSITAALFLRRFVEKAKAWVHFDIYAWNPSAKSARPEGAEVQAARLLFDLIESRYGAPAKMEAAKGSRKNARRGAGDHENADDRSIIDDLTL